MTALILTFQTLLWLGIAFAFVASRSASIFHPFTVYLAFHGLVFVIRPILEHVLGFDRTFYSMMFYPTEDQIQITLILTSAALVAFAVACWVLVPVSSRIGRRISRGFDATEWWAFGVVFLLLSPLMFYSLYASIGSATPGEDAGDALVQMDKDPNTGIAIYTNTTGYIAEAQKSIGALGLMLVWGARFRLWSLVPLLLYIFERAYVGWSRWTIILTLMTLGLLFLVHRGRRWIPVSFLVVALPIFLLFQQLGENRDAIKNLVLGTVAASDSPADQRSWLERQDGPDFANFDFLTYVVDVVPEKSGTYTYFTQYLQLLTEPIPRILWPNKPIGEPIKLVDLNDYGNFAGWTLSIVGDGWMSGGWLGVIITMAGVGYAFARIHRWFWRGDATNFKILAYCIFLPLTVQTYRDGTISIAKFALFTMAPLIFWHILVQSRRSLARARATDRSPMTARGASDLQVDHAIGSPAYRP